MTCLKCQHGTAIRFGYYSKRKIARYRCKTCRATFAEPHPRLGTHYLPPEKAAHILP